MDSEISKFLNNQPFLRYLLFYFLGIIFYWFECSIYLILLLSFILIIPLLCGDRLKGNSRLLYLAHLVFPILAYFNCALNSDDKDIAFVGFESKLDKYQCVVIDVIGDNKYVTDIKFVSIHGARQRKVGSVLLTIKSPHTFELYDTLVVIGSPKVILPPKNPEEFDFKKYYKTKGVLLQHFCNENDIWVSKFKGYSIKRFAFNCKILLSKLLTKHLQNLDNAAIASALVLGVRSEMSSEILNSYMLTGTIHVLAISGLHLSILFFSILWLFTNVFKLSKNGLISGSVGLVMIWFFAFVTGLGASVVRAAVMITIHQIGILNNRKVNTLHTLFSSTLVILIYNPFMVFDVGLQLSIFAVLGILLFMPIFQKIYENKSVLIKYVLDLLMVSISAQLGVFALGLYYFSQFPNLFLISNFIEIILSTIALYVCVLKIIFAQFDWISIKLAYILELIINAMNQFAVYISRLPFVSTSAYLNSFEVVLIILIVIGLAWALNQPQKIILRFLLALFFGWAVIGTIQNYSVFNSEKIIIYSFAKSKVVDFYFQGNGFRVEDRALKVKNGKEVDVLRKNMLKNSFGDDMQKVLLDRKSSIVLQGKRLSIQIVGSGDLKIDTCCDVLYLLKIPKIVPCNKQIVVQTLSDKILLESRGFLGVHCLQSDGSFVK